MFPTRRSLIAAVMVVATLAAAAAPPNPVPHKEQASGTLIDLQPGTMIITGQGVATHFGLYTIEGSHDFDDQGNVTNGQFTTTTADGATISGTYSGTYFGLPSGQVQFDVHAFWLEGTGRLEGVTGQGDVVAILDAVATGAEFEYETIGELMFP